MKLALCSCFFLLLPFFVLGQKNYSLHFVQSDTTNEYSLEKYISLKHTFSTQARLQKEINASIVHLISKGFILARIDQSITENKLTTVSIALGTQYSWVQLQSGNVEDFILQKSNFRDKFFHQKAFQASEVSKLFNNIISYCETHGYPFASIKLTDIAFDNAQVSASLHLDKNQLILIDSLVIHGDAKVDNVYMSNYLNIKKGDFYNETSIKNISKRIKELAFVTEQQAHQVEFTGESCNVHLYLKHKKASDINGIVGVLPNETTGEITVTGDARINLQNALGKGEKFSLNWRRLQLSTQDLVINTVYPFILSSPIGTDIMLKIYRKDTTFADLNANLGLQYYLRGGNYFKVFYGLQSSNLISTYGLDEINFLPEYADISVRTYGIGLLSEKLDYRLNPRKGYKLQTQVGIGNKEIRKNAKINPLVYDSLELKTVQQAGTMRLDFFVLLGKRSTINIAQQFGYLINQNIFRNELYRIGGIRTLRGFDEESLFASTYLINTIEYRFLLEENSYFHIFTDIAWYEDKSRPTYFSDTPYGFGSGVSFETNAGIFSVSYALGAQQNNPILLRTGKVHFGFINYF
jgi:outer membrane protein assembly factor BamA